MEQVKALVLKDFEYLLRMSKTYFDEMLANRKIDRLKLPDVPKACEKSYVKVMKLIKQACGNELYASLYHRSMKGEELKANYESEEIDTFKSDLFSIRCTLQRKLLGDASENNVFAAISQAKQQLSNLMTKGNNQIVNQLQNTLQQIEETWNNEKQEIRTLLTNQLGSLEQNIMSQFSSLHNKIDIKQEVHPRMHSIFQSKIVQQTILSQQLLHAIAPKSQPLGQQKVQASPLVQGNKNVPPSKHAPSQSQSNLMSKANKSIIVPNEESKHQTAKQESTQDIKLKMKKAIEVGEDKRNFNKTAQSTRPKSELICSLFASSHILASEAQKRYVIDIIPNRNPTTRVVLLYRGSRDGWSPNDFHRKCDGKGPTICLVKSSRGKVAGGYTSISWTSDTKMSFGELYGDYKSDSSAFLFSVDTKVEYPVIDKNYAVYHHKDNGFSFGKSCLSLEGNPMNQENGSQSTVYGYQDGSVYKVGADREGGNILTGDKTYFACQFTCSEAEVYHVLN